jgi:hypothetical protein
MVAMPVPPTRPRFVPALVVIGVRQKVQVVVVAACLSAASVS